MLLMVHELHSRVVGLLLVVDDVCAYRVSLQLIVGAACVWSFLLMMNDSVYSCMVISLMEILSVYIAYFVADANSVSLISFPCSTWSVFCFIITQRFEHEF